jgi:hypothetical protein
MYLDRRDVRKARTISRWKRGRLREEEGGSEGNAPVVLKAGQGLSIDLLTRLDLRQVVRRYGTERFRSQTDWKGRRPLLSVMFWWREPLGLYTLLALMRWPFFVRENSGCGLGGGGAGRVTATVVRESPLEADRRWVELRQTHFLCERESDGTSQIQRR